MHLSIKAGSQHFQQNASFAKIGRQTRWTLTYYFYKGHTPQEGAPQHLRMPTAGSSGRAGQASAQRWSWHCFSPARAEARSPPRRPFAPLSRPAGAAWRRLAHAGGSWLPIERNSGNSMLSVLAVCVLPLRLVCEKQKSGVAPPKEGRAEAQQGTPRLNTLASTVSSLPCVYSIRDYKSKSEYRQLREQEMARGFRRSAPQRGAAGHVYLAQTRSCLSTNE